MSAHQVLDFFVRAAVALALGAVIGLERQWRQRMAGLRTNALVSLGAALFVLFGLLISRSPGIDPTRIAAYVVSGVGFLGAGVILRDGVNVRGINTAATIWCSSAVGVLAGGGYVIEATLGAILVAVAHVALRPMGRQFDRLPASERARCRRSTASAPCATRPKRLIFAHSWSRHLPRRVRPPGGSQRGHRWERGPR